MKIHLYLTNKKVLCIKAPHVHVVENEIVPPHCANPRAKAGGTAAGAGVLGVPDIGSLEAAWPQSHAIAFRPHPNTSGGKTTAS